MRSLKSKCDSQNYQAEYGRGGSTIVDAITKPCTKDFHGFPYGYYPN
jgi:hypothetical protein